MMTRREATTGFFASAALAAAPNIAAAQGIKPVDLPAPRTEGGMPLMSALKLRHSTREYSDRPLTSQTLSDLLWSAFGINRPNGDRTAPYWRHIMVIDVYAAMADGVWLYEPRNASLTAPPARRYPRANRSPGLRGHSAAQPRLCRPWRAYDRCFARGSPPLRVGRCRLYRPKCLSVLRLGGLGYGVSRGGRLSEARPDDEAAGSAIRDLCADGGLSSRLDIIS